MSNTTVEQFALERSMPAERLLEQLRAAGVSKNSAADSLSTEDKQKLLAYLKQSHGDNEGQKITVSRKQTSSVKTAAGTVQVQTRRRRSIQIDDGVSEVAAPEAVIEATVAPTPAPVIEAAEPVVEVAQVADHTAPVEDDAEARRAAAKAKAEAEAERISRAKNKQATPP